ncbi:exocyst complex protein EXO70 [Sodiomyces alkalinus F11]|uniref:Exocyst complex protein EXO70 n=1 Tax=Sodiomyces alkalinus (strain CBS 110278 / VKM F-3762 / F11) TaxID=1314773 RepID=A0A3N2PJY6_SODAK|nr:exocyst complex protein EXO70 [Sodiomyces alkalinus F11]ROT34835.1 exocyst complex protein EXO70 [Sodiomyces alkalinus F11]
MTAGLTSAWQLADEEARAEVDVLNSRLEKTTQLTKKIQVCLGKLEATGKSVHEVAGPLNSETRRLQTLGHNVYSVLAAIERLRQPADSRNDEEQIIRTGPDKIGLQSYLASAKRLNKTLVDMQASNLRVNQQTKADLSRLVKSANSQLQGYFQKLLRAETPRSIEPLHYITKGMPFPVLPQATITPLGLIRAYVTNNESASASQTSSLAKIYSEIRGPYLVSTLANLSAASVNTAKKRNPEAIYRSGTNGIGTYAQAMEGLFLAEHENICSIFDREDWRLIFRSTCDAAVAELARALRDLNSHVKTNLNTDCYLAYEITEIMSNLSTNLEARTGELKTSLAAALRPVRETAKTSLAELLEDTNRKAGNIQMLPVDGASMPLVSETMQRLQTMAEFLRPISSIMISLGDGGWKSSSVANGRSTDAIPSLASFDIGADGKQIFAHYCVDTIESLLSSLYQKAQAMLRGGQGVLGVFLANNVFVVERIIRDSDLGPLLLDRLGALEQWRKKAKALYTAECKDVSAHLFDVIHTSKHRPASGQPDSLSVVKSLSSKDKDNIKGKFHAFNTSFDDLVSRYKSYHMEPEVRQMFARDIQQMLEPLYTRFWDRYHEVDKGKGKYVRYDKTSIGAVFISLY